MDSFKENPSATWCSALHLMALVAQTLTRSEVIRNRIPLHSIEFMRQSKCLPTSTFDLWGLRCEKIRCLITFPTIRHLLWRACVLPKKNPERIHVAAAHILCRSSSAITSIPRPGPLCRSMVGNVRIDWNLCELRHSGAAMPQVIQRTAIRFKLSSIRRASFVGISYT